MRSGTIATLVTRLMAYAPEIVDDVLKVWHQAAMLPFQSAMKPAHGSRPIVGVIGGHANNTNSEAMALAEKAGACLALLGITVACGGEDGIMEAVCRGAKVHGGTTLAITKSNSKEHANRFIDYVIPTSLDLAFMNVLAWSADGVLAFDGRFGTLCEVGLALDIGKPIALLGRHSLINTQAIGVTSCIHLPEYTEHNIETAIHFLCEHVDQ